MKKNKRERINLFFENNGLTEFIPDRAPFLNAMPPDVVPNVTLPVYKQHPAEFYFGVGTGEFFNRFCVNTTIPLNNKFFY